MRKITRQEVAVESCKNDDVLSGVVKVQHDVVSDVVKNNFPDAEVAEDFRIGKTVTTKPE